MELKTWVVVAAFNEEKRLGHVIRSLLRSGCRNVVVVDDGSTDGTSSVASQFDVWLLRHVVNRGQGAALRTGIQFALENDAEILVTFDGDGQHDANEIRKLIAPIASGKADVALGSRFLKESSAIPLSRKLMLKAAVCFTRLTTGLELTDTHNGFRAMSKCALKKIELLEDRMAHASELLQQIAKNQLEYVEVPVTIRYSEETLRKGQSNIDAVKILLRLILIRLV